MRQQRTGVYELPGDQVAVGHCGVVDDENCGRSVVIVKAVRGFVVEAVPVRNSPLLPDVIATVRSNITPISRFGIRLRTNGSVYWCEQTSSCSGWNDSELGEEYPVDRKALECQGK